MAAPPAQVASAPANKYNSLYPLFQQGQFALLDRQINQLQRDYEAGKVSDLDLLEAYRALYNPQKVPEGFYDAWVKQFPGSYAARVVRGEHLKMLAHQARGGAFASETPQENFDKMGRYYEKAFPDLQASLGMTRKPVVSYLILLDMANNVSSDKRKRELLDQGLAIAPDSFILRRKYMHALETRWGGDPDDMQDFLSESQGKGLSPIQMKALEAMVYKDRGWVAVQDGDPQQALPLLIKSATLAWGNENLMEPGDGAETLGEIAMIYMKDQKYKDAITWFDRALALPDSCGCGYLYANRGLAHQNLQHYGQAITDYKASADQDDAWAMNMLGEYYWHGFHVPIDKTKAIEYFKRAAAKGNERARQNLEWANKS